MAMACLFSSKTVKGNDTFTYFRPITKSLRGSIYIFLKNMYFSWLIKKDKPKRTEKRKHHISLCIMFKDEAVYLREWIEYHKMVGVDHFYLYDNNSSDAYESVIENYLKEGSITLIHWPKEHAQVEGYEDCIRRFKSIEQHLPFIGLKNTYIKIITSQKRNSLGSQPAFINRQSKNRRSSTKGSNMSIF